MATRQASATTGKPKKPRLQVICGEALLARIEGYASAKGWSISRSCEDLIEKGLDSVANPSSRPEPLPAELPTASKNEAEEKFQRLLELARLAGIL